MTSCTVALLGIWALAAQVSSASTDIPQLSVVLSSRAAYLLGEPVRLTVAVTNKAPAPIRDIYRPAAFEDIEPQIITWLSADGKSYARYTPELPVLRQPPEPTSLGPGATWIFDLTVCYQTFSKQLAFPKPGKYYLKVAYPLMRQQASSYPRIESNCIEIHIRRPEEMETKVWERINTHEFLYFLQTARLDERHPQTAKKVLEVLEDFPQTSYKMALRYSLHRFYLGAWKSLKPEEAKGIRTLLGLVHIDQADDARLDVPIRVLAKGNMTVQELLESLAEQSNVRLHASAELTQLPVTRPTSATTLRHWMKALADDCNAFWSLKADAYYLTRQ
jgi:hypothetical protein